MNTSIFKNGFYALTLLALAKILSGCVESTNIAESSAVGVSSCGSLLGAVVCVKGRFIDEAVENLDYECGLPNIGTVKSRTDVDGSFSCPNNSIATFSLTNPNELDQKIILGEVKIQRPADIYLEGTPSLYFYVTPYSLAGGINKQRSGKRALNIARLLQTLNAYGAVPVNLPTRSIKILGADKSTISSSLFTAGEDDIFAKDPEPDAGNLSNPAAGTFDKAVQNYLASIGKTQLVSSAEALVTLKKGIHSTHAGAYASGPTFFVTNTPFDADFGNMIGYGIGADSNKRFLGQFWALVDRRGRMLGGGIYSYGPIADTDFFWSNPQAMDIKGFGTSGDKTWAYDHDDPDSIGDLAGLKLSLRGDLGKEVRITQGVMSRGAIAGSATLYQNLFSESSEGAILGEWNLEGGGSTYIAAAPYTFEHTVAATTLMNPNLWDPDPANTRFPLPLNVTLFNTDSTACPTTKGCPIANIHMVILADGNIVSDINDQCGADLDPVTLKYPDGSQEYSLGLVSNIIKGDSAESTLKDQSGNPITIMTLLVMLPNEPALDVFATSPGSAKYLPYIQFASNFGGNSLLRVDGGDQYQMYGLCDDYYAGTAVSMCTTQGSFAPGIAEWTNHYTSALGKYAQANSLTTAPELAQNNDGFMKSSLRTCP